MAISRIFRRASDHYWWHWRPACKIYQSHPTQRIRGKTIVYLTSFAYPTTYTLCPGCKAEDARVITKDVAKYVKRDVDKYVVNRTRSQPVRFSTSRY